MFEKRLAHEDSGEMIPENRLLEDENSGYAIVPRLSKYIKLPGFGKKIVADFLGQAWQRKIPDAATKHKQTSLMHSGEGGHNKSSPTLWAP